jgi:hypothetical protein
MNQKTLLVFIVSVSLPLYRFVLRWRICQPARYRQRPGGFCRYGI